MTQKKADSNGADIRIKVGFFEHHKTKKLQLKIRRALAAAAGRETPDESDRHGATLATIALVRLWLWMSLNRSKGVLHGLDRLDIAINAGWDGDPGVFVDALVGVGFFAETDDGLAARNWEIRQGHIFRAQERSQRGRDNASKRWSGRGAGNSNAAAPEPAGNSNAAAPEPAGNSNAPTPTPAPAPTPAPTQRARATEAGRRSTAIDSVWRAYVEQCNDPEFWIQHKAIPERARRLISRASKTRSGADLVEVVRLAAVGRPRWEWMDRKARLDFIFKDGERIEDIEQGAFESRPRQAARQPTQAQRIAALADEPVDDPVDDLPRLRALTGGHG